MVDVSLYTSLALLPILTSGKVYNFVLWDEQSDQAWPYSVVRNGVEVKMPGTLTLTLNPEELTKEWAARNTVTQTPYGAWVDTFGAGLPRWHLKGHTGWKQRGSEDVPGGESDGYLAFHALHDLIEEYFDENKRRAIEAVLSNTVGKSLLVLKFLDHADDDAWIVEPDGMPTKMRSKDRTLFIQYDLAFTGLRNLFDKGRAVTDHIVAGVTGGPERTALVAAATRDHLTALDLDLGDLELKANYHPAAYQSASDAFMESVSHANAESAAVADARQQVSVVAGEVGEDVQHSLAAGMSAGGLPGPIQAAAQSVMNQAHQLTVIAASATTQAISSAQSALNSSVGTLSTAIGLGSGAGAGAFKSILESRMGGPFAATLNLVTTQGTTALAALVAAAPPVPTAMSGSGGMIGWIKQNVLGPGHTLGDAINAFTNGTKKFIEMPFASAVSMANNIRFSLSAVADTLSVFHAAGIGFRNLRTSLRNLLCSVQSILAFPYNFRKGLKDSLQNILNLFKLSGCASTFPALKPLSWQPQISLKVPRF